MNDVVDVDKCKEMGANIVRRMTGGGATFHDREVTYSLFTSDNDPSIPSGVQESFRKICSGVIKGLSRFGIESKFSEPNDIAVNGRKISGNAQTRKSGVLLQQGTILLDVDTDKMFSVLKIHSDKLRAKMLSDARERVTGINTLLGKETSFDEVCDVLVDGFKEALGVDLVKGKLTESELELARKRSDEKYKSEEWNYKR
jgi:lipoate-protein ligase A